MKTDELENYIVVRNKIYVLIETLLTTPTFEGREPVAEVMDAVDRLVDAERSLCIAIIQDKEDQVRDAFEQGAPPTEWYQGQIAMARKCTVALEHSRGLRSFYIERGHKE